MGVLGKTKVDWRGIGRRWEKLSEKKGKQKGRRQENNLGDDWKRG